MNSHDESNDYVPSWIYEITPESSARDALVESFKKNQNMKERAETPSEPASVNQANDTSESSG